MKNTFYLCLLLLVCFYACNNESGKEIPTSENGVDAARNFIRSTMDGNYDKAKTFMLRDSQNSSQLTVYERYYNEKMKPDEKQNYKAASINIHEIKPINDSTTVILYSNTFFRKDTHQLKSVRIDGRWLVDFKYYFQSKDSLP